MAKEMNKTKPFGVRFSLVVKEMLEKKEGIIKPQRALNFLEDFYVKHEGLTESNQESPQTTAKPSETPISAPKIEKTKDSPKSKVSPKSPQIERPEPPEGLKGIDLAIWKEENWK
jgi:hypothetical protein